MTEVISAVEAVDVRFPTSRQLDGSDAMNPDPAAERRALEARQAAGS
ncbi:hypothetical protein ACTMTI_47285 [Nonomuraea sp. H19]